MSKRLFDHDPATQITRWFHWDDDTETFVIETQMDVSALIEQNKSLYAATDERARYGELDRVASLPMNVYMDLKERGILRDEKALRAWLNDPENRYFRTRPGRV